MNGGNGTGWRDQHRQRPGRRDLPSTSQELHEGPGGRKEPGSQDLGFGA